MMVPLMLGEVAELVAVALGAGAIVNGVREAVTGLRAKAKAKAILANLDSNSELTTRINRVKSDDTAQLDSELRKLIMDALDNPSAEKLTKSELRQIRVGLEQPNATSEKRFVGDLTG